MHTTTHLMTGAKMAPNTKTVKMNMMPVNKGNTTNPEIMIMGNTGNPRKTKEVIMIPQRKKTSTPWVATSGTPQGATMETVRSNSCLKQQGVPSQEWETMDGKVNQSIT